MMGACGVERLRWARLVAIVRIDDIEVAVVVAGVAIEAGVGSVEVTFTIPQAAVAIQRLRHYYPAALIGAGTIRRLSELDDAAAAGAEFLVAAGLNPPLLEAAQKGGVPMLPGVFTASQT